MVEEHHKTFIDRIVDEESINREQQEVIDLFRFYEPSDPAAWALKSGSRPNTLDGALNLLITAVITNNGIIISHNHDGIYEPANPNLQLHVASPHAPVDAQKNADITQEEIEGKLTGTILTHDHDNKYEPKNQAIVSHIQNQLNPHSVNKFQVGLGAVENVEQIPISMKGTPDGVAELGPDGKLLSSQLPSSIDVIIEYPVFDDFPVIGEPRKIYVDKSDERTYRWSGSFYVEISPSLALGETASTAYRGDRGSFAYTHARSNHDFEPANPAIGAHLLTLHAPVDAQKNSLITKAEIEAKLVGGIDTHHHDGRYELSNHNLVEHLSNTDNPHFVTKTQIGLGNLTNDLQIPMSQKGAALGVAELDAQGKVLPSQLPSSIDDIVEFPSITLLPQPGLSNIIYVTLDDQKKYRWSGTDYRLISDSLALGETEHSAYRGDRGSIAFTHSQSIHAPINAQKNSDITKAEIEAKLTGVIETHTHSLILGNIDGGAPDSTYWGIMPYDCGGP